MATKILLVEDDEELRENLLAWLELRGFACFGAESVADALAADAEHRPDVVVTDLALPDGSGLDVQAGVLGRRPDVPIVFLTGHGTMEAAVAALREGRAYDFLTKPLASPGKLLEVLERALGRAPGWEKLTPRERDIVQALCDGLSNAEIAGRLGLNERTVRNRLTAIYAKLGVDSRARAILACRGR